MKGLLLLTTVFFSIISTCFSQPNKNWEKWSWLIGEWRGEGAGQPGQGSGIFSFSTDLNNKILVRKAHSEYPANGSKPAVIHDDWLFVYLDNTGNPSKAIYFDNEGHTINYTVSYSEKSIVLLSDKIPNAPVFRLTYTMLDDKSVDTAFEMSQDGQNFITYVEGKSSKVK